MELSAVTGRDAPWVQRPPCRLRLPEGRTLDAGARPLVMGVLNVTPDSFSDGGRFLDPQAALEHGRRLCDEGADILDVGGESTRPGGEPVGAREEIERAIPIVRQLAAERDVPISIDTQKAEVAAAALDAGACMINDVSALRTDPEMAPLAAERDVPVVLMHMQGTPRTMQDNPTYDEVVSDIVGWLRGRMDVAAAAGIHREQIIVDPGFGFGKGLGHNLELLRRLHELHALGAPVMVGTSRKSMIGMILEAPADGRLYGTLATVAAAAMSGCHVVRVHDVRPALDVVRVCEAVRRGMDYDDD